MYRNPIERLTNLEKVYLVGEVVPQAVNDKWASEKQLYNMFGPTEATCGATIKHLKPGLPVTIGRPNPSSRIYILGEHQQLLPRGVVGEIYLAGVQVARGYVGRPHETATRFIDDSICTHLQEQMYRTGDRGYWNDDEEIVYIGRTDRQVKLRGYRLDLNDIELRISQEVPAAATVAVTTVGDFLVAILTPNSLDPAIVRSHLMNVLPSYSVPHRLAAVEKIPLTPAGKIDYKAITKFAFTFKNVASESDMTLSQQIIAVIWREILGLPVDVKISAMSSFLELGGNSIRTLLLSHRLTAQFGKQVSLKIVMETNTLAELTNAIEAIQPLEAPTISLEKQSNEMQVASPIEYEWWLKYQLSPNSSSFNVTYACSFTDSVDLARITMAWNTVLQRHAILRSRYVENGSVLERIYADHPPTLLRQLKIDFHKEVNSSFFLDRQHPIRVLMSQNKLLVIASHIICDLTTMKILLKEVGSVYRGEDLEAVKKEYRHTTCWSSEPSTTTLEFWSKYMSTLPDSRYDIGKLHHPRKGYSGTSQVFRIPTTVFRAMAQFTTASQLSFHQLCLAAVCLTLSYTSKEHDMILGAPCFNRTTSDDIDTVGLFLEPLPIRIRYPVHKSTNFPAPGIGYDYDTKIDPFLLSVHASSRSALMHELQWNRLLKHLDVTPEYPNHPLFDIMVTFHEYDHEPLLPIPTIKPLYTWASGSKFKLMVEFQAISPDSLILRLEHDETCFTSEDIGLFRHLLTLSLFYLSSGLGHEEVKRKLHAVAESFSLLLAGTDISNLFAEFLENLS